MPTIALVDDDRNILTSVSIALETEGYRIQTYTDGASALEGPFSPDRRNDWFSRSLECDGSHPPSPAGRPA